VRRAEDRSEPMIQTNRPRRGPFKTSIDLKVEVQHGLSPHGLRLWKAVLMQALDDLKRATQAEANDQFYLHNPRGWFLAEHDAIGGFEWVCRILGLNIDIIRSEVIELLNVPVGEDNSEDGVA